MVNELCTREGGWSAPSTELNTTPEEWLINPGDHGWPTSVADQRDALLLHLVLNMDWDLGSGECTVYISA